MFRYRNAFSLPLLTNNMKDTFLIRMLTDDEKNILYLMLEDIESGYRAKIILLKDEGYIQDYHRR